MWKGRADLTNRNGEEHGSVTPYQLTTIMVGAAIGVGVLVFPRLIVEQAGTGAPLATLLGAFVPAVGWPAAVALSRRLRGRTPAEYAPHLITKPLGWLYVVLMILFLAIITAMAAREFGEVLKTAVLPNTPIEVTIMVLLLTSAYFVRFDLQVFARVFEIFFPIMVVPITIIGVLSLKNARFYYLLPVVDMSWVNLLNGAALAGVGYVAAIIGKYLLPSLNQPKKALSAGLWGKGISAFVYMLVVSASLAVFGPEEIKHLVWPTLELVKTTSVPGFILERLEAAFIGIWVAAVFTTVGATYYCALLAITQLFKFRDHKVMAIPLVPILYMIAMTPGDIHSLYRFTTQVGLLGLVLIEAGTFLFLVVAYFRGKGAGGRAKQAS